MSAYDTLPRLDSSLFPDLPDTQPTNIFLPRVAGWNTNREYAAGIIITLCIQQKRWMPIRQQSIIDLICRCSRRSTTHAKAIFRELSRMSEERLIEVHHVGDITYYYPTLAFLLRAVDVTRQHEDNFIWRRDDTLYRLLLEMAAQES